MEWHLEELFHNEEPPKTPYDVLILNQPLNVRAYELVARHASKIACVDGGANRLWDVLQDGRLPFDRFPNAIVGDLDSLHDHVRDFFAQAGRGKTQIVHDPEQESTDFTKALRWLREQNRGSQGVDVVVLGSMGGRVDQGLSTVHHLLKAVRDAELLDGEIYLLSEQSLSFVVRRDWNEIHGLLSPDKGKKRTFGENVGIIPLCGPAVISTKGLEWDVKDWRTEMGGQISTSNHVKSDVVEIEVSEPVLFTVELVDAFCAQ